MQIALRARNALIQHSSSHHPIGAEVSKSLSRFTLCYQNTTGIRVTESDRPDRSLGLLAILSAVDKAQS